MNLYLSEDCVNIPLQEAAVLPMWARVEQCHFMAALLTALTKSQRVDWALGVVGIDKLIARRVKMLLALAETVPEEERFVTAALIDITVSGISPLVSHRNLREKGGSIIEVMEDRYMELYSKLPSMYRNVDHTGGFEVCTLTDTLPPEIAALFEKQGD